MQHSEAVRFQFRTQLDNMVSGLVGGSLVDKQEIAINRLRDSLLNDVARASMTGSDDLAQVTARLVMFNTLFPARE